MQEKIKKNGSRFTLTGRLRGSLMRSFLDKEGSKSYIITSDFC
jgi:hypothetical protein